MPVSWPFAPIEELDFYLENPREPDLVHLEIHASGHLDRVVLEAALADALAADPAARRHLAAASPWSRRLRWEAGGPAPRPGHGPDPGLFAVTRWSAPGELAAVREQLSARTMPLTSTAARLILAVGPDHDVVFLQVHHAAFDGISSMALLDAVCTAYRDRAGVVTRPLNASSWQFSDPVRFSPVPSPGEAGRRGDGGRAAFAPPGLITRIAAQASQPHRPGYGCVLTSLPVPRLARRGTGPHPTVNDLLVTAMILTVDRWNTARGRRGGTIRISVPVNDRNPERRWEGSGAGAGNLTRLARVAARSGRLADPAGLLAQVAAQTRAAKEQPRAGLDEMSRLLATAWAPTSVKRRAARLAKRLGSPVLTDTSMVSNLGVLSHPPSFSGTGQEPLWFYGPAQMPRGMALGAVTISGLMYMCVTHSHALLDASAAADFTGDYCRTLARLISPGDSPQ
jgi:hypothetical protein